LFLLLLPVPDRVRRWLYNQKPCQFARVDNSRNSGVFGGKRPKNDGSLPAILADFVKLLNI